MFAVVKQLVLRVSTISLRGILLIAGLVMTLIPWHSERVGAVDEGLLRFGSYLLETPKGSSGTAVVEIPREELDIWQQDINRAGRFAALLSNILHSPNTLVGVLFDQPMDARNGVADNLIETVTASAETPGDELKALRALVQRKQFLLEFLHSDRVVLGVSGGAFDGQKSISIREGVLAPVPYPVRKWYWYNPNLGEQQVQFPRPSIDHYPILMSGTTGQYAVIPAGESDSLGGFLTYYLYAFQRFKDGSSDASARLVWQQDAGVTIGGMLLPTSPAGKVIPLYGLTERMTPPIDVMSIEDALARGAFPDKVFLAAAGDELALKMAAAAVSVERGAVIHTPWWHLPVNRILLLLLTLYIVFIIPRVVALSGVLITVLIVFILLVVQVGAEATQKLWLPFAAPMLWAVGGHILIWVWQLREAGWQALSQRADDACLDQANSLFERGQLERAVEVIKPSATSEAQLRLFYNISSAHASKRQYKQAVDVLKEITARKSRYRDVEQKIEALMPMISANERAFEKTQVIDATVMLDQPLIDRPRLGRYEIREELGRGAMGTVYLGYDPRISRQVAIKTLSYNQFQAKELDQIKLRFFREAEAAGRLNHPNIVSVFDVGEENDLAFIAMDFAEGKPLSEFAEGDNLLPVFEVYRIICDVAQALEYAHSNNIVHRDIKPGNIMYNPSPYQLKVTDFGIARLIDDSRTSTGEILGSPLYMAPEQLKGKKVDHTADIFSLGVTFYQLLCGQLPFDGNNLASLTYEIIHGKHKSVRAVRKDLPTSASRIVNQALQKNAEDRYESAGEMALVLKKAIKRDFAHEAKRAGYL